MNRFLCSLLSLIAAAAPLCAAPLTNFVPKTISVMTDTNGLVIAPTNFTLTTWGTLSNLIVGGNLIVSSNSGLQFYGDAEKTNITTQIRQYTSNALEIVNADGEKGYLRLFGLNIASPGGGVISDLGGDTLHYTEGLFGILDFTGTLSGTNASLTNIAAQQIIVVGNLIGSSNSAIQFYGDSAKTNITTQIRQYSSNALEIVNADGEKGYLRLFGLNIASPGGGVISDLGGDTLHYTEGLFGTLDFTGTLSGTNASLTNINAQAITAGTVTASTVNAASANAGSGSVTNNLTFGGTLYGTNASLTNVNAQVVTAGTVNATTANAGSGSVSNNLTFGGTLSGTNASLTNINAQQFVIGGNLIGSSNSAIQFYGDSAKTNITTQIRQYSSNALEIVNADGEKGYLRLFGLNIASPGGAVISDLGGDTLHYTDGSFTDDLDVGDGLTFGGTLFGTNASLTNINAQAVTVATEAYDASGWDGDLTVPTKDAVRDKIETIGSGTGDMAKAVYDTDDNGAVDIAGIAGFATNANYCWIATNALTANNSYYLFAGAQGYDLTLSSNISAPTITGTTVTAGTVNATSLYGSAASITNSLAVGGTIFGTNASLTNVNAAMVTVTNETYDATGWNSDLSVPTKDSVRDKIEALIAGTGDMTKAIYDTGDNGAVDKADTATLATNAVNSSFATNANYATTAAYMAAGAQGVDLSLSSNISAATLTADIVNAGEVRTPTISGTNINAQTLSSSNLTATATLTAVTANFSGTISGDGSGVTNLNYLPNVEDFGADGSDALDDTLAIQAALTASGGRAYFPAGQYYITNTLSVGRYPHLVGEGMDQTFLRANADGITVLHLAQTTNVPAGLIADMTIFGNSKSSNGIIVGGTTAYSNATLTIRNVKSSYHLNAGIQVYAAMWTRLEDCELRNNQFGLQSVTNTAGSTLQSTTLFADRCHFNANTNAGIYCESVWGFRCNECVIEDNLGAGVWFYSPTTTTVDLRDAVFSGCWFEGNNVNNSYTNLGQVVFTGSTNKPIREVVLRNCHFEGAGAKVAHLYFGPGNYSLENPVFAAGALNCVILEDSPYVCVSGTSAINPANSYTGTQTGPYEWFRTNLTTFANAWIWGYGSTNYAGRGAPLQPATLWVNGGSGTLVPALNITGSTNGSGPVVRIFGTLTNLTY